MDIMGHTEDEEEEEQEQSSYYGCGGDRGSRFSARRLKPRSNGHHHHHHHQLLLMDCVGDSAEGASKEIVTTLPEYERLSQSARLSDDPDPKKPPSPAPAPAPQEQKPTVKQSTSPPRQQQKPVAWRLIEYVWSRNKSPGGVAPGCSSASDGDSKSSDGEKESGDGEGDEEGKTDKNKKKKRSSWLPDPDRRWPVQGFY